MLLLIPLLPLIGAVAFLIPNWRNTMIHLAPWTAFPGLLFAIAGREGAVNIPWLLLHSRMGMDMTGRVFLGITAFLWMMAGFYAISYVQKNKTVFFTFFLLSLAGNLGLILSFDMISFYSFFALMSFSAYGLIVHSKSESAIRAGRVYIVLVVMGEILVFTALALSAYIGDSLYFADLPMKIITSPHLSLLIGFALFGFGIKAGLLPLHVWLPLAHPVAPTPASAVLSACMIKAGVLGWLRILPLGEIALVEWGGVIVLLGFFGALYGAIIGILQTDVKTVLAYSSISQMGILTFLLGVGLQYPLLWPEIQTVLLIYLSAHALMKGTLFLTTGMDLSALSKTVRYALIAAALLPALAMAGAPLSMGGLTKELVKSQVIESLEPTSWKYLLKYLLGATSYTTAFLMARYLFLLWKGENKGHQYISWGIMVGTVLLAPFFLLAMGTSETMSSLSLFSFSQVLPILAALLIGAYFVRYPWSLTVPTGDVLVLYQWILSYVVTLGAFFMKGISLMNQSLNLLLRRIYEFLQQPRWEGLIQLEECLIRFPVFGVLLIGLTILFFFLQLY